MTGEVISKLPGTFMDIMSRVRENEPLIHCMTHAITMNDSANAILAEHRTLYDAIREHDAQKARHAAKKHLHDAYKRTLGKYWTE